MSAREKLLASRRDYLLRTERSQDKKMNRKEREEYIKYREGYINGTLDMFNEAKEIDKPKTSKRREIVCQ